MLQLEMEKAGQQLAAVQQMQQTLAKMNILKNKNNIIYNYENLKSMINFFFNFV